MMSSPSSLSCIELDTLLVKNRSRPRRSNNRGLIQIKRGHGEPEKQWWGRPEFLIPAALAVVSVLLAVPSILPRVSAEYSKENNVNNVPAFAIKNDGLIGINDVKAVCVYTKVQYADPTLRVENNSSSFTVSIGRIAPAGGALALCPNPVGINGLAIMRAFLTLKVIYCPDFSFFTSHSDVLFESRGDLLHWTAPSLF